MRGDIVDIALAGYVSASRYVCPAAMAGQRPTVPMRAAPEATAVAVSELLYGEAFEVFEISGDWCWGRTVHDGYLGWIEAAALGDPQGGEQRRISARRAPVFATPDIKAQVTMVLPLGARVSGCAEGRFFALAAGGFVHLRHIDSECCKSPLEVARSFAGAPYVWGGRTPDGVDCSGLVQAALNACGLECPRDSDQQLATLGTPVAFAQRKTGDLLFFPGHVGILANADKLFHANAHWMVTVEEPLADVVARLTAAGVATPVLGVRRLTSPA